MKDISAQLKKAVSEYEGALKLLDKFTIYAPKSGMVIYKRGWDGQKQGIGTTISVWDPVVAELPNLKEMKSKTYVNEIDISKVKVGQPVTIGVDAFPDRHYTGVVTEVANIGQQLPNTNAKVFEVVIAVNEFDSILRPAMTTKNEVLTAMYDSVLYLPLDCIQSTDSMSYVYIPGAKVQVILGPSNENEVVIREGLKEGDMVYLVPPSDAESYHLVALDPEILRKYKAEKEKTRQNNGKKEFSSDQERTEMSPELKEKMGKDGAFQGRKGNKSGRKPKP